MAAAIVFYISGHGFGHASRQIEVLNALGPRLPAEVDLVVRTSAARWLFDRTLRTRVRFLPGECDTGIAQIDALHLDHAATASAAAHFYSTFTRRTDAEAALLREHDATVVIADAPPLACAAAAAAGVPSIVMGNFTWDWIYEEYAEEFDAAAAHVLPLIRQAYAAAREGWRLPMHGGFEPVNPPAANITSPPAATANAARGFSMPGMIAHPSVTDPAAGR